MTAAKLVRFIILGSYFDFKRKSVSGKGGILGMNPVGVKPNPGADAHAGIGTG
jgi:hypothetical protein